MFLKFLPFFLFFILSSCHDANETQKFCAPGQRALGSKCFQFFDVRVDFNTAESICRASFGHLVSIHSSTHNEKIANIARRYTDGRFWIGAKTHPSSWHWTDGSDFNYENYASDQPVSHGIQKCLQMYSETELWMTGHCEHKHPFACEFPTQEAPRSIVPTCPSPTIPSHCPSGYTWFDKTDFCYKNYVRFSDFHYARTTCQKDGGELASIHSRTENDFIMDLSKVGQDIRIGEVWIGLVMRNGKWQWTDGTSVTYTRWNVGEPNFLSTEHWSTLHPDGFLGTTEKGTWNNNVLGRQRAFVCKRAALH